jgi:hypothetical protein
MWHNSAHTPVSRSRALRVSVELLTPAAAAAAAADLSNRGDVIVHLARAEEKNETFRGNNRYRSTLRRRGMYST